MKSILLIIPYFGKWPIWFDAYLVSIAANPTINWLCPTDCEIPLSHPDNITFLHTSLKDLNKKVNQVVDVSVPLNPRKFCDLKPAYADIFSNEVDSFDFWGICDMDIVWGNIRKFMTPEILDDFDIICSRPNAISGHFNLFRNEKKINTYYKTIKNYKDLFSKPKFMWFDEVVLTDNLMSDTGSKRVPFRVFWKKNMVNKGIESEAHQEYFLDRWLYYDGKIIDLYSDTNKEYMYLHFINWKRTMKYSEIKYSDKPQQFYISYSGMHYKTHSGSVKVLNSIKNIFDGYYAREYRRINKNKLNSLLKRINNKIKRK